MIAYILLKPRLLVGYIDTHTGLCKIITGIFVSIKFITNTFTIVQNSRSLSVTKNIYIKEKNGSIPCRTIFPLTIN